MNRLKVFAILIAVISISFSLASCEKAILDGDAVDDATEETADGSNIEQGKGQLYASCSFSQVMTEMTRATSTPLYECANRVQFVIMQDGNIVYNTEQINGGGTSFGTLSVNLDPGTYRLMVFAHNETKGSVTVNDDGSIIGYGGRATDSFSYSGEVVIQKDKRKSVTCKLTRCVAYVSFASNDEIPSSVTKMKITYSGFSSQYDLVNQIGGEVAAYETKTVSVSSYTSTDGKLQNVRSYAYLPGLEQSVTAKFEFYDDNDNVVYTRTLEGIDMKINAKTSVTADFFQSDGIDAKIEVDTDWGDPISVNL